MFKKNDSVWPPKRTVNISQQIAYHKKGGVLFFRKNKSVELKVSIKNVVSIVTEHNGVSVIYRGLQKERFVRQSRIETLSIVKNGTLKKIEKFILTDGFLRINQKTIVRKAKVCKGGSEKNLCRIYYRQKYPVKGWYVGKEYPVGKKYQKDFQKFLDGKLSRRRTKAERFYRYRKRNE